MHKFKYQSDSSSQRHRNLLRSLIRRRSNLQIMKQDIFLFHAKISIKKFINNLGIQSPLQIKFIDFAYKTIRF